MRRVGIILTAGAALVLALVVPTVAEATSKSSTSQKSSEITAQAIGLDDEITAQGKGKRGKHGKHGYRDGRRRHGHHHKHYRHHRHHRHYYGYYGHPYYGGGYYGGGYGCGYDYDCGRPGQTYDCTRYRGPDGKPTGDPHCRYDARCDCWYHTSDRAPRDSKPQAPPDQYSQQPAPDQAQPAPADQGPQPAPQPAPDSGSAPY